MADLEKQLEGVESESPADNEGQEFEDAEAEGQHQEAEAEKKDKRTLKELQREFQRKLDKISGELESVATRVERTLSTINQAPPQPAQRKLDDMSLAELEAQRPTVPAELKTQFETYYTTRVAEEKARNVTEDFVQKQTFNQQRISAGSRAQSLYPDLKKRGSEFYDAVNAKLAEYGDDYLRREPRAVLHAANEVATEMGVVPRRTTPAGPTATRGQSAPTKSAEEPFDEAKHAAIENKLKYALGKGKDGKQKVFDKDNIKARKALYQSEREYRRRG